MKTLSVFRPFLIALACLSFVSASSFAAKPDKADKSKNKHHAVESGPAVSVSIGAYFNGTQRDAARQYYGRQAAAGKCPPGLAKKNNGCLPPGQARKWAVGRALPGDVVVFPLPNEVVVRIGAPPQGYRYVRQGADILLIAIGTQIVVDAISDLMR